MKDKNMIAAKLITRVLDSVLRNEANSASCIWMYQPKAPKSLDRYKKIK